MFFQRGCLTRKTTCNFPVKFTNFFVLQLLYFVLKSEYGNKKILEIILMMVTSLGHSLALTFVLPFTHCIYVAGVSLCSCITPRLHCSPVSTLETGMWG